MALLKASTQPVTARAFSLRDVEAHAAGLLARARQQAEAILVEAQKEAELIKAQARQQATTVGMAEGRKKGEVEGQAAGRSQAIAESKPQLSTLIQSLSSAAQQIERSRQDLLSSAANDVVRLSLAIAKRVVHHVGQTDGGALVQTVSAALKYVVGRNDVKILVHPSQHAMLQEAISTLKLQWPALKHVEIAPDPAIAAGGARIISGTGEVDATLDGMISQIAAELLGDAGAPPGAA